MHDAPRERNHDDDHERVRRGVTEERRGRQRARKWRREDFSAGWTFQLNRRNHHRVPCRPPCSLRSSRYTPFADERKFLR